MSHTTTTHGVTLAASMRTQNPPLTGPLANLTQKRRKTGEEEIIEEEKEFVFHTLNHSGLSASDGRGGDRGGGPGNNPDDEDNSGNSSNLRNQGN